MPLNDGSTKPPYQPVEQARVLLLLCHKQPQGLMVWIVVRHLRARLGDEKLAFTSLAQLKVRERASQHILSGPGQRTGQIPFRFRPVCFVRLINRRANIASS